MQNTIVSPFDVLKVAAQSLLLARSFALNSLAYLISFLTDLGRGGNNVPSTVSGGVLGTSGEAWA
jgi:hypothetical protein